jgi:hypothetical protein
MIVIPDPPPQRGTLYLIKINYEVFSILLYVFLTTFTNGFYSQKFKYSTNRLYALCNGLIHLIVITVGDTLDNGKIKSNVIVDEITGNERLLHYYQQLDLMTRPTLNTFTNENMME